MNAIINTFQPIKAEMLRDLNVAHYAKNLNKK